MTRYTIVNLEEDADHHGTGLSVDEAFACIMALTETEYVFARDHGVMRLFLTSHELRESELFEYEPEEEPQQGSDFRSPNRDDSAARQDIMLQLISGGRGGYFAISDERYAEEEAKNAYRGQAITPRVGSNFARRP